MAPNKEGVVVFCCVDALLWWLVFAWQCPIALTYNSDGLACWFCVFAPISPLKRPPLCGWVEGVIVDAPKSPPVAGVVVVGLFGLPNRPPDCGCDVCGAEMALLPLGEVSIHIGSVLLVTTRLQGRKWGPRSTYKRLPPVLMLSELERPKPAMVMDRFSSKAEKKMLA